MSRIFDASTSNYLKIGSLSVSAAQDFSFACYVSPDVVNTEQVFVSMGSSASESNPRIAVKMQATGVARTEVGLSEVTTYPANSSGTLTATTWQLLVGTFDATGNTAYIYLNSATPQSASTSTTAESGTLDQLTIGVWGDSSPSTPADGKIAQVAVWDGLRLSNSDVTSLLAATTTTAFGAVQSGSLLCHYPLTGSDLSDATSSLSDLSVTGTVAVDYDDPLVEITSVSTDDTVSATENPWSIAGSGFGTQ